MTTPKKASIQDMLYRIEHDGKMLVTLVKQRNEAQIERDEYRTKTTDLLICLDRVRNFYEAGDVRSARLEAARFVGDHQKPIKVSLLDSIISNIF